VSVAEIRWYFWVMAFLSAGLCSAFIAVVVLSKGVGGLKQMLRLLDQERAAKVMMRWLLFALGLPCIAATYSSATVVVSPSATAVEQNVAVLLADRLHEKTGAGVELARSEAAPPAGQGLTILIGMPTHSALLRAFLAAEKVAAPTMRDPGAEGFVLHGAGRVLAAAAVDQRGSLYAAGEILRRVSVSVAGGFEFPESLRLRTAPAFRVRGTEVSQGATMRDVTNVRLWTKAEWRRAVLDYALAGANLFSASGDDFEFLRSYGLMTHGGLNPNALSGHPEWSAVEPIGRLNFVCLSVPEARRMVLENIDAQVKHMPPYDILRIPSGDAGGCWCEKCEPWGKTYMLMCADIARIIHKYLPAAKVYITNQELSNAGDQFIFDYLNERPRDWLAGIYYGPGSNAMSWNGTKRPDHRLDLFHYPGFGILDGYLKEMVRQMPRRQAIQMFTDLTHWTTSQYGMMVSDPLPDFQGMMPPPTDHWFYELRPDPAFAKTYNRRAFFVRPRAYYRIFQETMRYGEGEIIYSEGHHDQFNQWIWLRLLWSPHTSLDDVIGEYTRAWFGPEAAPAMSQAILEMERNLTEPVPGNDGISHAYRLVREAGARMPARIRQNSYLWPEYLEKSVLDRYIQLRLARQTGRRQAIEKRFATGDPDAAARYALERLAEPQDSPEMAALAEEAREAGETSARLFGLRNIVYFTREQDLVGLGWIERQVRRLASATPAGKRAIARLIARYEDPGEGGFYDDAWNPKRSPHMVHGREYSVNNFLAGNLSNANLPSQRTMAYTEDAGPGVTFRYTGLDRAAAYRVRFAFVRPRFLPRYAMLHPEKTQSIYANDRLLAADVEVPEWDAQLFEYPIPTELTRGGELTIRLEKAANIATGRPPLVNQWKRTSGWATIVSDVWLMKTAP
jgi:hypothetical protein